MYINNGGTWKSITGFFINVSGTWKRVTNGFINVSGTWKRFFSSFLAPVIQFQVEISRSTAYHNSTYPVTLTGKKYHFSNANSFSYEFYSSPNSNGPWTRIIGPISTTNPSIGSSSNVTYQLTNANFTSTTMYFQFRYTGTNTTPDPDVSTTSSSNTITVTYLDIPAPPSGFPNINQSTIGVASTASSGTWIGDPTSYSWNWYFNNGTDQTLTFEATKSISSIQLSGTVATVSCSNHGFKDSDLVTISSAGSLFNASNTSIYTVLTNSFQYTVLKPNWSFSSQYAVGNSVTNNGIIYTALLSTPTRTTWAFSTNYTTNQHVDYNNQVYRATTNTPSPRSNWSSNTAYTVGQFVNYNSQVYQCTINNTGQTPFDGGPFWQLIDIYPGGSGGYWTLINIYPSSTTYWQSQQGTIFNGGNATGPNYYEGTQSSPVSYTISSFPSSDYKTGTLLKGFVTRLLVTATNIAPFIGTAVSATRTIFGFPSISLSTPTVLSTSASIPYSQIDMSVYDIDVQTGGSSILGYPKTNQANSSPILINGLVGNTSYIVYVTPKNGDNPRVSGSQKTSSFTTLIKPVNTVAPTISPLNNRGHAPVETLLTSTLGTWTGVSGSTTYTYRWEYLDPETGWLTAPGTSNTSTYTYSSAYNGFSVRCVVTAFNGSESTSAFTLYNSDPAVSVGTISPSTATQNSATTFTSTITGYPTSYVIDWGDGTTFSSGSIASNTATVNVSQSKTYTTSGSRTITITAQPGNKSNSRTITVNAPAPTASNISRSDGTITPSQPSTISFSIPSTNTVAWSWTNGSPITSVNVAYSGAGTNGNFTDSSSPYVESSSVSYSSSGTFSVTITNTNNNLLANVSWNQSGAQSYSIVYSGSNIGPDVLTGNSSAGSVSVNIPWSSSFGSFTLNSLTVFSGTSQTGSSTLYNQSSPSITISLKTSTRSGSTSLTYTPPAPVNTSIPTLSPTSIFVGTTLTAGVGTWSNGPTSYDIRIFRGTQFVNMTETQVAAGSGTSLTYTVTQADYNSGQRYFRTFVNASNSGGSSGFVAGQERGPIQISAPVNTAAPVISPSSGAAGTTFSCSTGSWTGSPTSYSYYWEYFDPSFGEWIFAGSNSTFNSTGYGGLSIRCTVTATNAAGSSSATSAIASVTSGGSAPSTPTNIGLTGSGVVSWTASSGATSYEIEFFTAQSSSGLNAAGPYTVTGISSSPYQLTSPYASPNNWARVRVRARNSNGASAYSAWVPSATTYT